MKPRWLPEAYRHLPLVPAEHGHTATVYHLGETYILKIFAPNETIEHETALYPAIAHLPIPLPIAQWHIRNRPMLLYPKRPGHHPDTPTRSHLLQIGDFLRRLHAIEPPPHLDTPYSPSRLDALIALAKHPPLDVHYNALKILPFDETVIVHGDLFRDNALFDNDKLGNVIDWSDAGLGDGRFDLGVVGVDWCFDGDRRDDARLSALLEEYDSSLAPEAILPYIRYALLYYATTRHLAHRDYQTLLQRLERLNG
jgi:homoserine kinase type II